MTTNFPSGLDAFTNPSATDAMDSVTVPHATQHADLNDAVEALEAKVGVDGSAVTTSLDYKVGLLPTGHVGSQTKSVSSVITTTPNTLLSTTVDVVAGRDYLVMYSGWTYATSTTMNVEFVLLLDGVSYQVMNVSIDATGDNGNNTMARVITAPTTGSVTFEVQAYTSTGTTYMRATSGAIKPSIMIIDVGDQ